MIYDVAKQENWCFQISDKDGFPTVVCFRCEKQLQNAYHFRQLAESSSKHFALINQRNSNTQTAPRILNVQSGTNLGETVTNQVLKKGKHWIQITNQNSQKMDVTLKSNVITDKETNCVSPTQCTVYMVDVNGTDGDIEVKRRSANESDSSHIILNKLPTSRTGSISTINMAPIKLNNILDNNDSTYECTNDDQSEHSDAISFLLKNKHLKSDEDTKSEAYHNRKYECTVCGKKFVGKSNLIDHLRYHANIRNFKCNFCAKTFIQSGSLKSHLRTHTGKLQFSKMFFHFSFNFLYNMQPRNHTFVVTVIKDLDRRVPLLYIFALILRRGDTFVIPVPRHS